MNKLMKHAVLLLSIFFFAGKSLLAQTDVASATEKTLRELFVPFEELDLLIGKDTNRVYMKRAEYEQLEKLARAQRERELPAKNLLLEANYSAEIYEGRATIEGEIQIELLDEGWHALPLSFNGVGIRSALLDGAPAALAKNDQGQTLLFVSGLGKHRLTVDMVLPVSIESAQQTVQFQVPKAPAGKLNLAVPGNVEIKSGAVVVSRNVDLEANVTKFEILPTAEMMSILVSLNNKKLRDQSTVIARGVIVEEITQGYERLHATMSMGVLNGASDEFRFAIDDDLEVNSVSGDLLSRWSVETTDQPKQLVIKLRSPATERVVINVRLDRLKPKLLDWQMPRFEPLGVAGYSAVIGLLIEERLSASAIEPKSLIAIDSTVLSTAMPASLLSAGPDAPQLRPIAAFYAAQSQYSLESQFSVQPRRLRSSANSLMTLSDQGLSVSGGFSLMPENEKLFFVDFLCPAQWSIDWLKDDQGELKFDRFPATDIEAGRSNANATRVRVLLPTGVAPGEKLDVLFQAQNTPVDWLSQWETRSIPLPSFPLLNADTQVGAIAVQVQDDLSVIPESTDGLLVMNNDEKTRFRLAEVDTALAFRYETPAWQATIKVSHVAPRMTGKVLSFVQLHPESMISHTELTVTVDQARTQIVAFSLPETTPTEVTVRGMDGVVVNDSSSTITDDRRFWRVQLAERQMGTVRLAIDFTQSLNTNEKQSLKAPIVRAENVDYQSGKIAVEGHSELEVDFAEHPRSVDIGELVDADYQVGKRLLGVYGYVGILDALTANIAKIPVHGLPTTIVQRAELVTVASTQGINQTAARFQLRTNVTYVEVRLPVDAKLWSVILDGKPALPQREQDRVLIALPPNRKLSMRDLQMVYETPNQKLRLSGHVDVIAPELFERNDRMADGMSIPIADLKWELVLPNGYRATAINGNLAETDANLERFSIQWLLNQWWQLGGGQREDSLTTMSVGTVSSSDRDDEASASPESDYYFRRQSESKATNSAAPPLAVSAPVDRVMDDPFGSMPTNRESQPAEDLFGVASTPQPAPDPAIEMPTSQAKEAKDEQQASNAPAQKAVKLWALEGVRSLAIDIDRQLTSEHVSLTSFGVEPRAQVSVVHQSQLNWLAIAVGAVVFIVGALFVPSNRRTRFVFITALVVCVAPLLTGWDVELAPVTASVLLALLMLLFFLLIIALWIRIAERVSQSVASRNPREMNPVRTSTVLLLMLNFVGTANAQIAAVPEMPGQMIASPEQLTQLLSLLGGGSGAVKLPEDAIVVPYDPTQSADVMQAEKLLVPYHVYVDLWNRAHPEKKIDSPDLPASHAWSAAAYDVELESGNSLRMTGRLTIEQFTDKEVAIPLNLSGCVLEKVSLDGKPPRLQMLEVQPQADVQKSVAEAPSSGPNATFILYSKGKGSKQLELTLRWKLDKNSGWQAIDGIIPSSPACKLTVTVAEPKTEVRFAGGADRSLHETSRAKEQIVTSVSSDGRLSMQWRDKITEANVDQGLTVQARSVFDIQEDSLKFAWHGSFEFRRGRRESLTLQLPSDYLVQKVVGDNIRGWTTKINDSIQQLDVELLKAVSERESFSLFISKQSAIDPSNATEIALPQIKVPDAMLQQGQVAVRRSLLLELRTNATNQITRIDAPDESQWLAAHEEPGPVALHFYQAFRYSQVPFDLKLVASAVKPKTSVQFQSLLRISQREKSIETRLLIKPSDRPIYRIQMSAPADWKLKPPVLEGDFQWSLIPDGDRQQMQIYLANGQTTPFPIILSGQIDGAIDTSVAVAIPKIEVLNASGQSGEIVVQADPAYDVRTENLQGCETTLLDSVNGWLADKQRESARLVVRFHDDNYSGQLRVSERAAIVNSLSVTNVKVTDRAIEDTIFIEASIRAAGIREFSFLLPTSMANARIQAPMLRQKNILPVTDRTGVVRVQLLLQNEIMGQLRVVVEHDHELTSERHAAPIPIIETGTTDRRLITLENSSRDELITKDLTGVERLERSQLQQRFQSDLLVGKSSEAYLVREGATEPTLSYETASREVLATAGARIGLAQGLVVVDELGTYRATQEFRIENRTEPFLEVELPEDARLWTVNVAGDPVKPALSAGSNAAQTRRLRIPLVKTAEGDLDYAVVLKYGGQVPKPTWLRRIDVPLIQSVNINVELSQVKLRLPDAYKWFNFDGTLGRVESESDLQAGWLSFRTRQLSDLTQLLRSSGTTDSYSKARASTNLSLLESSLRTENQTFKQQAAGTTIELEKQLSANSFALQAAQQQAAVVDQPQVSLGQGNRGMLNDLYSTQWNGRSLNALVELGDNFDVNISEPNDAQRGQSMYFKESWLLQNKLKANKSDEAVLGRLKNSAKPSRQVQDEMRQTVPDLGDVKKKLATGNESKPNHFDDSENGVQSYRRRLQSQNTVPALQQAPGQAQAWSDNGMMSMFGNSIGGGGMGGGVDRPAESGRDGFRQTIKPGNMMFGGAVNVDAKSAPGNRPDQAGGYGMPQDTVAQPVVAYMASLDVELPQRGREYLFSTPRGNAQLSVQGFSQRVYERLISILTLLFGALFIWLVYRVALPLVHTAWGAKAIVAGLILFGTISVMAGYLPFYGCLAILAAIVVAVPRRIAF